MGVANGLTNAKILLDKIRQDNTLAVRVLAGRSYGEPMTYWAVFPDIRAAQQRYVPDRDRSIVGNLPNQSVNVVIEDPKNPNLLFAGVDFGLYVTIDGGKIWTEMIGIPTQPVHDLEIHPRENEIGETGVPSEQRNISRV